MIECRIVVRRTTDDIFELHITRSVREKSGNRRWKIFGGTGSWACPERLMTRRLGFLMEEAVVVDLVKK